MRVRRTKLTWIGSGPNEISLWRDLSDVAGLELERRLTKEFTVAGNGSGSDPDVFANVGSGTGSASRIG